MMKVKVCNKCGRSKVLNDFGKHRLLKDGLQNTCRRCKSELNKKWREESDYTRKQYVRINAKNRRARHGYQVAWKEYFTVRYGKNPKCQICDKELSFQKGKERAVHFDHRHGNILPIKSTPASWYTERPCTDEHIKTFESCDFGILCGTCNQMLPTENRGSWLKRALEYHEQTITSYCR